MWSLSSSYSRRVSSCAAQKAGSALSELFNSAKPTTTASAFGGGPIIWTRNFWAPPSSPFHHNVNKIKPSTNNKISQRFYNRPNWYNDDITNNRDPPRRAEWLQNLMNNWSLHPAVLGLLAANVGVGLMWMSYGNTPGGRRDMQGNFSVSIRNLEQGRFWTLLTTSISVDSGWGLLFNGFTLYFLGNSVAYTLGTKYFLPIYFGGAAAASLVHLAYFYGVGGSESSPSRRIFSKHASMNGASAAIMSVAGCYAAMYPTRSIMLYGILPVPAALLVGTFIAISSYQAMQTGRPIWSEIAGPVFGVAAWFLLRRRGY